jgi:hypothetical protein
MLTVPADCWLAGKGPSLDKYDWSKANEYRYCINETVFVVPNPYAAIALDYAVLDKYREAGLGTLILRKSSHVGYSFKNQRIWSKGLEATNLYSTAVLAVQLLAFYGHTRIHFVGFDSMDNCLDIAASIESIGAVSIVSKYKDINIKLLEIIAQTGIEPVWEHR